LLSLGRFDFVMSISTYFKVNPRLTERVLKMIVQRCVVDIVSKAFRIPC
jgi:uncharacterized protein YneF (UPF0154 family)